MSCDNQTALLISTSPTPHITAPRVVEMMNDHTEHHIRKLGEQLNACAQTHQGSCDGLKHTILPIAPESNESIYEPQNLRVLDIETKVVIPAPPNCWYVALSYVWEPPLTAMVEGGLSIADGQSELLGTSTHAIRISELPRTIAHAIKICEIIKQKYLWVDSLCINQTDPADKAQQISQMDRIYSHAFATIVAATASDPKLGIPILDQGLAENEPDTSLESSLTESLWNSRGWTYQEVVLSRRLLIFTSKWIYFSCEKVNHLSQWELPSSRTYSSCWRLYNQALEVYTQRNLSNKGNTLDAFSGVLRAFARYTDDIMINGLPARQLFYAILWHPISAAERQPDWPSWSWAGWTDAGQKLCRVKIPSQEAVQDQWDESFRGRRFFSLLNNLRFCPENGDEVPINLSPDDESLNQDLRNMGLWSDDKTKHPNLAPDRHYYEHGCLRFKASTIILHIVPELNNPSVSEDAPQLKRCRLMFNQTWLGTIFLNPDSNGAYPDTSGPCEFILVARFLAYIHRLGKWHFKGLLPTSESPVSDSRATEQYPAVFPAERFQAAKDEYNRRFEAWKNDEYHSQHGWREGLLATSSSFNDFSWNSQRGADWDPHRGMPFPPEVHGCHVMWIERKQDRTFRKAIGVIAGDFPGWESEEFCLG